MKAPSNLWRRLGELLRCFLAEFLRALSWRADCCLFYFENTLVKLRLKPPLRGELSFCLMSFYTGECSRLDFSAELLPRREPERWTPDPSAEAPKVRERLGES